MKLDTYKLDGSKDSSVNADKTVFGIKANQSVVHQAVNAELTNLRQGTHSSKNRANVIAEEKPIPAAYLFASKAFTYTLCIGFVTILIAERT